MFFMRQTIIVMSRHIEFDQKNEIFGHYQLLDTNFYKTNSTGDLMNRMAEDVSRVRMYTGPAMMYLINLIALITFCVISMLRKDVMLTIYVLTPLPLLAVAIYIVNTIIHKKKRAHTSLVIRPYNQCAGKLFGHKSYKIFCAGKSDVRLLCKKQ